MRCSDLRVRLLAVMSATTPASASIAACGSDSTSGSGAQSDAAASGDARSDARVVAVDDSGDALSDVPSEASVTDTTPRDSAGDESPPPSPRRPFLVGTALRSARSQVRDDWSAARLKNGHDGDAIALDPVTARELAKSWLADALEEHASVAAFARFTMMMLSVAAPPELVAASQRASLDEIAHARDCFALARRYGANDAGPGALDVHDALGPGARSLADLAALTVEEGCVGETLGAALAGEQLAVAVDPETRRILARIVRDEARHAELAWRFVAWAVAEEQRGSLGAAGVSAAIASAATHAIAVTRAMEIRPCPADLEEWHAHGRLTCAEARIASERAIVEVVLPCLAAIDAGRPADALHPVVVSNGCEGAVSPG
ncbi:MAG: hypothetical protein JWO86_5415 [Myxococcaceae bacterium]|nr:hypothetical protein [Myxococcaceae bacterium]